MGQCTPRPLSLHNACWPPPWTHRSVSQSSPETASTAGGDPGQHPQLEVNNGVWKDAQRAPSQQDERQSHPSSGEEMALPSPHPCGWCFWFFSLALKTPDICPHTHNVPVAAGVCIDFYVGALTFNLTYCN